MVFADRTAAGRELARLVCRLGLAPPVIVLALPRGGVPVAREVATALRAPLDVMVVRKIGMPGQPEVAIGAVASGGTVVEEADANQPVDAGVFSKLLATERRELERRERVYRAGRAAPALRGQTVVLVDDGIATGATMLAAVRAARAAGAASIVVAAPVAAPQAAQRLGQEADRVVVLELPAVLYSVGEWYEKFDQLNDAQVLAALRGTIGLEESAS